MPATLTPVPFPVLGLHEGSGYDMQPQGTTPNAKNVAGYDALKKRLRGGRRAGISKWVETQINGSNPVQFATRVGSAVPNEASDVAVDEDFSNAAYSDGTAPGYIGDDLVRWCRISTSRFRNSNQIEFSAANDWITIDRSAAAVERQIVAVAYPTTNDVTALIRANGDSSAGETAADECTRIGPFIRGDELVDTGIGARFIRVGADQVQLEIFSFSNVTYTQLVASATQTLNSSASPTADLTIRLYEEGNTLTAIANWPTQAISNLTVSIASATNAGETRGGACGTQNSASGTANWRILKGLTYVKRIPADPTVLDQLDGTEANPIDTNRYFLPSGWASTELNVSSGAVTTTTGPQTSASDPTYIAIDDTGNVVWDSSSNTANVIRFIEPTTGRSSKAIEFSPTDTHAVGSNCVVNIGIFVDSTRKNGIFYEFNIIGGSQQGASRDFDLTTLTLRIVQNGALVASRTIFSAGSNDLRFFKSSGWIRFSYNTGSFTATITQNGITILTDVLQSAEQTIANQIDDLGVRTVIGLQGLAHDQTAGCEKFRYIDAAGSIAPVDVKLLAVAGGTVKTIAGEAVNSVSGGSNALSSGFGVVQGQEAFGHVYLVDGINSRDYNKTGNIISAWTASAGTLPANCRLICLYRGRIVLSGDPDDPHNYFMSEVGDPTNFDYSATTAIAAVAGNNAQLGLVGDIITALIPFGDDVLIFGCDHTIWMMEGDPAAGGQVSEVTDKTGIAFGKAWCKDQNGVLYFWGTNGIYRMVPGGKPENMTSGRIDLRVQGVDLTTNRITMEWDYKRASLLCLIQPNDGTSLCRVIRWESLNGPDGAWWEDEYPASMGPTFLYAFDGPNPEDQELLLGTRDGYMRMIDEAADDDDGTEIEAYVDYAPFIAPNQDAEVILKMISPVLAKTSGPVELTVYTGQSAEEAVLATQPRIKKVLSIAGRNTGIKRPIRGYALRMRLGITNSERWAVESMGVGFDPSGKPRREAKVAA